MPTSIGLVVMALLVIGVAIFAAAQFQVIRAARSPRIDGLAALLSGLLLTFAVLNWAVCRGVTFYLGGSALNGGVTEGRFYLARGAILTEVSGEVFRRTAGYEAWTDRALSVSLVIASALYLFAWLRHRRRGMEGMTEQRR